MSIYIPADLPADPAEAYRRGWRDRGSKLAAKAGRVTSEAKAAAVRANGAKGGRPKGSKNKPKPQ